AINAANRVFHTRYPLMGWSGRAPAPTAREAGKGRQRRGARHVLQAHYGIAVLAGLRRQAAIAKCKACADPIHTKSVRGKWLAKSAWPPTAERGGEASGGCRSGAGSVTPREKSIGHERPLTLRIRSQPKSRRPANSRTARSRCSASTTTRRLRRCAIACRSA